MIAGDSVLCASSRPNAILKETGTALFRAFSASPPPLRPLFVIPMSGDVERGPEGEPVILSLPFFFEVLIAVRLMSLKAGTVTIQMIQIDPLKVYKTLTIVLMIYGLCSESKLRFMTKHGQRP